MVEIKAPGGAGHFESKFGLNRSELNDVLCCCRFSACLKCRNCYPWYRAKGYGQKFEKLRMRNELFSPLASGGLKRLLVLLVSFPGRLFFRFSYSLFLLSFYSWTFWLCVTAQGVVEQFKTSFGRERFAPGSGSGFGSQWPAPLGAFSQQLSFQPGALSSRFSLSASHSPRVYCRSPFRSSHPPFLQLKMVQVSTCNLFPK